MKRSISLGKGNGRHDLEHNTRAYIADNVDRNRIEDNIILKRQTLQEAYNECFGEANQEYNAKQKRSDRKITDYFTDLFGVPADDTEKTRYVLKNKHKNQSYYENTVQIGDMFDTGIESNPQAAEAAKMALTAYVNGDPKLGIKPYSERNPQFHVMDAVIHMDEKTPHLHLVYIPFATDYKRGMSVQQSHDKALKQMGYDRHTDYIEAERQTFREICSAYGLEPRPREEEKSRGFTYSTERYKSKAKEIRAHDEELRTEKAREASEMPLKTPETFSEYPDTISEEKASMGFVEAENDDEPLTNVKGMSLTKQLAEARRKAHEEVLENIYKPADISSDFNNPHM